MKFWAGQLIKITVTLECGRTECYYLKFAGKINCKSFRQYTKLYNFCEFGKHNLRLLSQKGILSSRISSYNASQVKVAIKLKKPSYLPNRKCTRIFLFSMTIRGNLCGQFLNTFLEFKNI